MKKPHWTQRPENRAKVRAMSRKAAKTAKAKRTRTSTQETTHGPAIEEGTFSYALGYVECWLATFAAAAGVPQHALAARVGAVLHRKARG